MVFNFKAGEYKEIGGTSSKTLEQFGALCPKELLPYQNERFYLFQVGNVDLHVLDKIAYKYNDGEHYREVKVVKVTKHRKGINKGAITIKGSKLIPCISNVMYLV